MYLKYFFRLNSPSATPRQHYNKTAGESKTDDKIGRVLPTITYQPITADANQIFKNEELSSLHKLSVQQEVRQQDSLAKNSQNSQQLSRDVPFSLEGRFFVQPLFLQVIRIGYKFANGVDTCKTVFTYKEVSTNIIFAHICI